MQEDGPELDGVEPARPNPSEAFLRLIRRQVLARTAGADGRGHRFGSMECDVFPLNEDAAQAADRLARALARIAEPLATLRERLLARLDDEAEDMDEATRNRIEAIGRSLTRRALNPLQAWQTMLWSLTEPQPDPGQRPSHVLFLRLDRRDGLRDLDVGLHRHWLDPTIPFATTLAAPAQGLLVTSATLRDSGDRDPEIAWASAEARVGAPHLPSPAIRAAVASPFDYAEQTRAFVVTDVAPGNLDQLAAAYRALFLASGGGGAWAVHRDQPAAGGACADRAGAGAGRHSALCPARRCDGQRHAGRYLPRRGGKLPAGHRRDARRRGCARQCAAAGGVRADAVAAARYPAPRTADPSVGRRSEGL